MSGWDDDIFGDVTGEGGSTNGTSPFSASGEEEDLWGATPEAQETQVSMDTTNATGIQKKKFGYKTTGLIIGGACLGIALLLLILSKVSITKTDNKVHPSATAEASAEVVSSTEEAQETQKTTTDNLISCWVFDGQNSLDFDKTASKVEGTVVERNFVKVVLSNGVSTQVMCRICFELPSSEQLEYYCTKSVWDSVYLGSTYEITYKEVQGYKVITQITATE